MLSPKLQALRDIRVALQNELLPYRRAPRSAPENVVNCRAYYLALSAVCDQTYRHIQGEAGLPPRLLPHSVYRYNLGQMYANNDNNSIQMTHDVYRVVDEHLKTIAAQAPAGEISITEALTRDANLGRVAPQRDICSASVVFMNVCGEGETAAEMQRSINRTVSKKYLTCAIHDDLANMHVSDAQTLAIAQSFQLAHLDMQSRVIPPSIFFTTCRALKQALSERAGETIPVHVHRNQQLSLLNLASGERQSLLRTAFGNSSTALSPELEKNTLSFLTADGASTGYDKAVLSRMLVQHIFARDEVTTDRSRSTARVNADHIVDIIAG